MYPEAAAEWQKYKLLQANDWKAAALYEGVTDEVSFRRAVSREITLSKERAKSRYVSPMFMASRYVWLGDKEQTIAWLEKAYQEHASGLEYLKTGPRYEPLRSDPHFQDLLLRLHFPPQICIPSALAPRKASSPSSPSPAARTVAVLPFQKVGPDKSIDFLRLALPDEIATILSYTRSLSIRPFATTSKYVEPNLDLKKAGQEMRVANIVTGHFLKAGEQLQITLEAVELENNRLLWRDTLNVPAQNMIAMQEQVAARARGGLASTLGSSAFTTDTPARPKNEEAYDLYLRSAAVPNDSQPNKQAIGMLERAVGLDSTYAPAWAALALRYYIASAYAGGGEAVMKRGDAAAERALALDPNFIAAGAQLARNRVERGELAKAYQEAEDLVRRRPDNAEAHFTLGYVLRYAGLLQESASQCDTALSIDPANFRWRSCAIVFLQRGDSSRKSTKRFFPGSQLRNGIHSWTNSFSLYGS